MSAPPVLDGAAVDRLRRLGGTELVRRMLELYLQMGSERVRALEEGARERNAVLVERAAHSMKSSAGNVGAIRLQRTAEALEAGAAAGTVDVQLVERFVGEYHASAAALRRILEEQT